MHTPAGFRVVQGVLAQFFLHCDGVYKDQGRAKKIGTKCATGMVKRSKKCARNIPPDHIEASKIVKPFVRPPIKFVPARDFNGSLKLPHALE